MVYCVGDDRVQIVGGAGKGMPPVNIIGTTWGDELRLATGFRAKVFWMGDSKSDSYCDCHSNCQVRGKM